MMIYSKENGEYYLRCQMCGTQIHESESAPFWLTIESLAPIAIGHLVGEDYAEKLVMGEQLDFCSLDCLGKWLGNLHPVPDYDDPDQHTSYLPAQPYEENPPC